MRKQMKIIYHHHSGFSIQLGKILLVFDYWRGENESLPLSAQLLPSFLNRFDHVYVFISHSHVDHYDPIVYEWSLGLRHIEYLQGDDVPLAPEVKGQHVMKPGDELTLPGDVLVKAYPSTDLGVSFHVQADGLSIFHAGDLNLWHWREESTPREIARAEADFYAAVDPLTRVPIDIAMFPVDPRMGGLYDAGANHFVMAVKPSVFIPIHWQGRPEVAVSYARTGHTAFTEVVALTKPREAAVVVFGEFDFQVRKLPVPDFPASGEPDEKPGVREGGDPFTGTDLPVNDLG